MYMLENSWWSLRRAVVAGPVVFGIVLANAIPALAASPARAFGVALGTLLIVYLLGRILIGVWALVGQYRETVAEAQARAKES